MVTLLGALPSGLPTSIPSLSTDILIILAAGLVIFYGIVAGHAALVREAISIYVGLVLAASFASPAYDYILKSAGGNAPVNETGVRMILLILPIVLLQFGRRHDHKHHRYNIIVTVIMALLTAMLLVSSILKQLDASALAAITDKSNFAAFTSHFHLVWLGAVPLAIAASAIFKPRSKHHHK